MPESEFAGPPTHRALSVPSELCDPATSFGSENESLGLNQRAALSELHKYSMQLSLPSCVAISCVLTPASCVSCHACIHWKCPYCLSGAAQLDVCNATTVLIPVTCDMSDLQKAACSVCFAVSVLQCQVTSAGMPLLHTFCCIDACFCVRLFDAFSHDVLSQAVSTGAESCCLCCATGSEGRPHGLKMLTIWSQTPRWGLVFLSSRQRSDSSGHAET